MAPLFQNTEVRRDLPPYYPWSAWSSWAFVPAAISISSTGSTTATVATVLLSVVSAFWWSHRLRWIQPFDVGLLWYLFIWSTLFVCNLDCSATFWLHPGLLLTVVGLSYTAFASGNIAYLRSAVAWTVLSSIVVLVITGRKTILVLLLAAIASKLFLRQYGTAVFHSITAAALVLVSASALRPALG